MKKLVASLLILAAVVPFTFGCGSAVDVGAELEQFRDVKMDAVSDMYTELKSEVALWETFTDPEQLMNSINTVILPNLAETLRLLEQIETESEEVTELKETFKAGIEKYKRGYANLLSAFDTVSEDAANAAYALLEEGEAMIQQYYAKLAELTAKYGIETE